MSTKYADLFAALAAPFLPDQVKEREENGRKMKYITERTVANRLDDVLGPENWWSKRTVIGEAIVHCDLTVRLPDGSTVTKENVGTGRPENAKSNPWKTAYSDSLKRAATEFGIARYLYRDGVPEFVREWVRARPRVELDVTPPPPPSTGQSGVHEPAHDQRGHMAAEKVAPPASTGHAHHNGNGNGSPPRSGKALYAWTKEQEQRHAIGLLKYLNGWAKLQDFPGRMVDWDGEQVSAAYDEAMRKIQSIPTGNHDAYEDALSN